MSPPHVNTGDLSGSGMTSDLKGITLCFIMTFPVVVVDIQVELCKMYFMFKHVQTKQQLTSLYPGFLCEFVLCIFR